MKLYLLEELRNAYVRFSFDVDLANDTTFVWYDKGSEDSPLSVTNVLEKLTKLEVAYQDNNYYVEGVVVNIVQEEGENARCIFYIKDKNDATKTIAITYLCNDTADVHYQVDANHPTVADLDVKVGDEIVVFCFIAKESEESSPSQYLHSARLIKLNGNSVKHSQTFSGTLSSAKAIPEGAKAYLFVHGIFDGEMRDDIFNLELINGSFSKTIDFIQASYWWIRVSESDGNYDNYIYYSESQSTFENVTVKLHYKNEITSSNHKLTELENGSIKIESDLTVNENISSMSFTLNDLRLNGYLNGVIDYSNPTVGYMEESGVLEGRSNLVVTQNGRVIHFELTISKELFRKYTTEYFQGGGKAGNLALDVYYTLKEGEFDLSNANNFLYTIYYFKDWNILFDNEHNGTYTDPYSVSDAAAVANILYEGYYTNDYFFVTGTVGEIEEGSYCNFYLGDGNRNIYVYGLSTEFGSVFGTGDSRIAIPFKTNDTLFLRAKIKKFIKNGVVVEELVEAVLFSINNEPYIEIELEHKGTSSDPLNISDVVTIYNSLSDGQMTNEYFYIVGRAGNIYNTQYCNFKLDDQVVVYGLWNEDGSARYGTKFTGNPPFKGAELNDEGEVTSQGDLIIVKARIQKYKQNDGSLLIELQSAKFIQVVTE